MSCVWKASLPSSQGGLLLRLACLLLALQRVAASEQPIQIKYQPVHASQQTMLIPILVCGPNNQKRDIRNYVAIAKELGTGLALSGLFKHYIDNRASARRKQLSTQLPSEVVFPNCFPESKLGYMPFEDVLDKPQFDALVPTTTIEELKKQGWNGKLDAIVVDDAPGVWEKHIIYMNRAMVTANITLPKDAPQYEVRSPMRCSPSAIEDLRTKVHKHRYVGIMKVLLGYTVNPNLASEARLDPRQLQGCPKNLVEAARMVRPAPWIRDVAKRFVQEKLGGSKYLAIHVRPYPDECLEAWQTGLAKPGHSLAEYCAPALAFLHDRFGRCAVKVTQKAGIDKIFLMTHPVIVGTVKQLLQQAGFKDIVTIDSHDVARLAACQDYSSTFLSMVEEEIAVQANQFIGTHISSITQSIVYERFGIGQTRSNQYLETMKC